MGKQYREIGKIKKIILGYDSQDNETIIEGFVTLSVRNRASGDQITIICFLDSHDARNIHSESFKEGDSISVTLYLLSFDSKFFRVPNKKPKSLISTGGYRYKIEGEIIEITPISDVPNAFSIILDCGLHIRSDIQTTEKLMVGDFVHFEGRLDGHIIEKVKIEKVKGDE